MGTITITGRNIDSRYVYDNGDITIEGHFNANARQQLTYINGTVRSRDAELGTLTARADYPGAALRWSTDNMTIESQGTVAALLRDFEDTVSEHVADEVEDA